jgi:hypothetical protein
MPVAVRAPAVLNQTRAFQRMPPNVERPSDISRDGHFLGLIDAAQMQSATSGAPKIQVVFNWFEELKTRVPPK